METLRKDSLEWFSMLPSKIPLQLNTASGCLLHEDKQGIGALTRRTGSSASGSTSGLQCAEWWCMVGRSLGLVSVLLSGFFILLLACEAQFETCT